MQGIKITANKCPEPHAGALSERYALFVQYNLLASREFCGTSSWFHTK